MRTSEVGNIPIEVSINLDYVNKEIRIFTDAGRCMRPLFVVDKNHLKLKKHMLYGEGSECMTWEDLLSKKCIELVDVEEEEGSLIALSLERMEKGNQ